ncbi:XdhC family protein [Segetibacter aerophilus]|uniref:Xanthine dehydrogenase accessory factor n=1 Tax=Segetibacter aerophilus TaxID=670293 RepID=A0A512BC94_9BACT|nr:XdhC/CoxI family protein [Segetibacter aerophilus]GEO09578.1 xanthine dehydrogenase accessory factor [Segetibacter aerophilus]
MKELKDIIRAYDEAQQQGKQTALATVVHLEGSAYRRPGARMLVTEDGQLTGAISGGCLEGDALRKAQLVIVQKKPMLVTYDTTDEDDAKLGVGLGCNGIISILIEPISADDQLNPIGFIKTILEKRQSAVLVTLFSMDKKTVQPGTCMLVTEEGSIKTSLEGGLLRNTLVDDAQVAIRNKKSVTKEYEVENLLTGFVELISPAVSLIIFGAGNDTLPLVQIASVLGWETTVVDGRPNYATLQRFPLASRILISKPENAISQLTFDANTVAVLMTHNYNYDIAALKHLLPLQLPYIGALGPKKKLDRMIDELIEQGILINEETIADLYGPTGLDIGAETADEIALSIVSEIKAVLSKRPGSSLRSKVETIHPRETQKVIPSSITV